MSVFLCRVFIHRITFRNFQATHIFGVDPIFAGFSVQDPPPPPPSFSLCFSFFLTYFLSLSLRWVIRSTPISLSLRWVVCSGSPPPPHLPLFARLVRSGSPPPHPYIFLTLSSLGYSFWITAPAHLSLFAGWSVQDHRPLLSLSLLAG